MHNGGRREGEAPDSWLPDGVMTKQKAVPADHDSFAEAVNGLYGAPARAVDDRSFRQLIDRLSPDGPDVLHDGMAFSVREVGGVGRVVIFAPERLREFRGILIQYSGYMQGPTSMLTDKILVPLKPIMEARGLIGVAYVHGGRGGEEPVIDQGRWGTDRLQQEIMHNMNQLLPLLEDNFARESGYNGRPPIALMGHSQGAQSVAHILADPLTYGFGPEQILGAILINSVALPYSQAMLRTPGLVTDIVRKNLRDVVRSVWSGDGLLFRGEQAFDTFLAEGDPRGISERRLVSGTYPAEAMYFVQTLTSGTSPSLDQGRVHGMPISLVTSYDDQLMGGYSQKMTHDHVLRSGADTMWKVVPGRHFSPIVKFTDESAERVLEIMRANSASFDHALQEL